MSTLPYHQNTISDILQSADRPEFDLLQRYEALTVHTKTEFVAALIAALVAERKRRLTQR